MSNRQPVVLLVDDDESILSSLQRGLGRAGITVLVADGADAAFAHLDAGAPDLILLDVLLPGGRNGWDICREVRKRPGLELVPVIFVTALDSPQDEAMAFAAGGTGFVAKPFELDQLVTRIRSSLLNAEPFGTADAGAQTALGTEASAPDDATASEAAPATTDPAGTDEATPPLATTVPEVGVERAREVAPEPMVGASIHEKLAPGVFKEFRKYLLAERPSARSEDATGTRAEELYSLSAILNLPEEHIARYIARFLDVPYVQRIHSDDLALGVLPKAFCEKNHVLPIRRTADEVSVVLSNPFSWELLETLRRTIWRDQEPCFSITSPDVVDHVFEEATDQLLRVPTFEELAVKEARNAGLGSDEGNPALMLANELLRAAVEERASDLHIEPKDRHTLVRFRVDGDMQDVRTLDKSSSARLISRFKALAGMDIAERRKPQDGSVEVIIEDRRLKLRLATSSTSDGETMVIRLLEPTQRASRLQDLGMATSQVESLTTMANRHQGMILVVGPTGSGKSTTIFSVLTNVDGHTRSIMSVEDPVEYRIPFANQQEVNVKAGVTFESLLRSAMRQDPDILFLGEIRDPFSAKAALDFASSGHLTVSTLHSANATSTIFRLERLGVERASMADSLLGIVSQKLVKRLCPDCRNVREIKPVERDLLTSFSNDVPDTVAEPVGCPSCRETGYHGREAVNEVLQFDPTFSEMVRSDASINQLRQFCVDRGDFMIYDHAIEKVRSLVCSPDDAYEQVLLEEMRFRQGKDARSSLGLTVEEPATTAAAPIELTPAPAPTQAPSNGTNGSGPMAGPIQVLVAEDDPVTSKMVETILSRAGYSVTTAADGAEALLAFGQSDFDVVVSDMHMPNLDGMQLLQLLVSKGMSTPVLFLTSETDVNTEGTVLAAGAADFIRKPVNPEVLIGRVRNSLPRDRVVTA